MPIYNVDLNSDYILSVQILTERSNTMHHHVALHLSISLFLVSCCRMPLIPAAASHHFPDIIPSYMPNVSRRDKDLVGAHIRSGRGERILIP